jgi:hypothetical protein
VIAVPAPVMVIFMVIVIAVLLVLAGFFKDEG